MWAEATVTGISDTGALTVAGASGFEAQWFQRGRLTVLDGAAEALWAVIKRDVLFEDGARQIDLWEPLRASLAVGDRVNLIAGCDKRFETCRTKFDNLINFQGFPDIPQEEWVLIHPTAARSRSGGSLR